jgi:membrane protease YdiL (CAAX protease family)
MSSPAARATGIAVLAALGLAALAPALRVPLVLVLVLGLALTPRSPGARWAFASALPVALLLVWGAFVGERLLEDRFECADPFSPVAWLRVAEAVVVIGSGILLARTLGTSLRALGFGRPTRTEAAVAVVAIVVIPLPSLVVGAILAEPFFGPVEVESGQLLALVPALTLALANGLMEELAYRGFFMSWLSRATGPTVALLGQAAIFGLAHTGSDFVGPALPVVLAVAAAGVAAGLIVRRTGSLWIPIAVHVAFDVPLYYAAACRLG